jgi:zinc and cadmium transporter
MTGKSSQNVPMRRSIANTLELELHPRRGSDVPRAAQEPGGAGPGLLTVLRVQSVGVLLAGVLLCGAESPAGGAAAPPARAALIAWPEDDGAGLDGGHDHVPPPRLGPHLARASERRAASGPRHLLLGAYCALIVAGSLAGGWLPSQIELTHTRMQFMISLVGGLMLGIGVFHMLPHALLELGPGRLDTASLWLMGGLVTMFFLLRAFHFHQHEAHALADDTHAPAGRHGDCGRDHDDAGHQHAGAPGHPHELSWAGVFLGLSLHTLIDGMALAASVEADAARATGGGLFGLGTFAAVLLHKPLDAVSITSLMRAGGWSLRSMLLANSAFALMCPLGAALFLFGVHQLAAEPALAVGCALAFAAGVFLCIALSDLLPEMELHSHHRVRLTAALVLGITVAWGIRWLEPEHAHPDAAQGAGQGTTGVR